MSRERKRDNAKRFRPILKFDGFSDDQDRKKTTVLSWRHCLSYTTVFVHYFVLAEQEKIWVCTKYHQQLNVEDHWSLLKHLLQIERSDKRKFKKKKDLNWCGLALNQPQACSLSVILSGGQNNGVM